VPGCPSFGGQRTIAQARARVQRSARPRSRVFNTQGKQHSLLAQALRVRSACAASFLRHGRHRPSTAHAGGGVGSIRRMQMPQALCSGNHRAVCEQNTVTANPSIERTYNGGRPCAVLRASRAPLYAAHVERYAAARPREVKSCSFCLPSAQGLRQRCAVARRSVVQARTHGQSRVRSAVFVLRQRCALGEAAVQRAGRLHPFFGEASAFKQPRCRPSFFAGWCDARAGCASATAALPSLWARHNPSIERTNNGGRQLAVCQGLCAPLFAAHVER
jgi:hypothetical protein